MLKHLICMLGLAVPLVGATAEQSVIRQYVHPVIIVDSPNNGQNAGMVTGNGSVISIAPGYVITAGHIVPLTDEEDLFVMHGGRKVSATPIKIDRQLDIALLSVNIPCPCATLSSDLPQLDDSLFSVGFPMYAVYKIQLLSTGSFQGHYQGRLMTTTTTAPGGSGGGVFVKEGNEFKLTGMIVAIGSTTLGPRLMQLEQEYNWLTFSVPAVTIRSFIKGTPADSTKSTGVVR